MTYFNPKNINTLQFGEKSNVGTGGMESKVRSASFALDHGCSVIICNGMKYNTIRNIMAGAPIGTMFTPLDMQVVFSVHMVTTLTRTRRAPVSRCSPRTPGAAAGDCVGWSRGRGRTSSGTWPPVCWPPRRRSWRPMTATSGQPRPEASRGLCLTGGSYFCPATSIIL